MGYTNRGTDEYLPLKGESGSRLSANYRSEIGILFMWIGLKVTAPGTNGLDMR